MLSRLIRLAAPAGALLLAACTTPEPPVKPAPPAHPEVAFEEVRLTACLRFRTTPGSLHSQPSSVPARSCRRAPSGGRLSKCALATDPIGAQRFFLANFTPWKVFVANDDATLVQGSA